MAEKFTKTDMIAEPKGQWYSTADAGQRKLQRWPALRFMSGNLCHKSTSPLSGPAGQPLTRFRVRVREFMTDTTPYTTGSFCAVRQKIYLAKLSLPDKYLRDNADDAPETRRSGCSLVWGRVSRALIRD